VGERKRQGKVRVWESLRLGQAGEGEGTRSLPRCSGDWTVRLSFGCPPWLPCREGRGELVEPLMREQGD